jgi:hypothetical protein
LIFRKVLETEAFKEETEDNPDLVNKYYRSTTVLIPGIFNLILSLAGTTDKGY